MDFPHSKCLKILNRLQLKMNLMTCISTPTLVGLPDIKADIEKNIKNNTQINLIASDFIPINDDIYYMVVSSFSDGENEIRRNEFLYVEDNNLYIFEYTYPYFSNTPILMRIGNWTIFI